MCHPLKKFTMQLTAGMTVNGGTVLFSDRIKSALGTPTEDYPASRGVHLHMVIETLEKVEPFSENE